MLIVDFNMIAEFSLQVDKLSLLIAVAYPPDHLIPCAPYPPFPPIPWGEEKRGINKSYVLLRVFEFYPPILSPHPLIPWGIIN